MLEGKYEVQGLLLALRVCSGCLILPPGRPGRPAQRYLEDGGKDEAVA